MMRASKISTITLCLVALLSLFSFTTNEDLDKKKVKVGFLVHDLVTDRWRMDMENFSKKIIELGGEPITRNAFADAAKQVEQGKELIDSGVKVIAVVAQNAKTLGQLVDYANKAGATIIAYDRLIMDCDLPYYISFNSVKVGELMAGYALKLKPKGNYVVLSGPSTDNNAILVKQGVMNILSPAIKRGDVNLLTSEEMQSWNALGTMMFMEEFIASNTKPVDAFITAADDMATGVLDVIDFEAFNKPVITGQNASLDACKRVLEGTQSMTVHKDITKLSNEAAILAMNLAKGGKPKTNATVNNGKVEVPSILFDPVLIDKDNLRNTLVPSHIAEEQLH